ncbi:hypothetical protein H0H93_013880 [Arthromyces matolae]|nr:hypothetical protein H0H93_013880 [Arthromyces matolae]
MDSNVNDLDLLDGQIGQISLVEDPPSINCLPAELLLGIFVLTVHRPNFIEIPPHPTTKLPWILGQVCSGWRRLAYSDPNLWKRFEYKISGEFGNPLVDHDQQRSLRRLEALLPYGLESFTVKLHGRGTTAPITLQHPLLSNLTKLHLKLSFASMLNSLNTFSSYFTNLEELGLITTDFWKPRDTLPGLKLLDVFSVLKRVSKLQIGGWSLSIDPILLNIPNIPWSRLLQLDLSQAQLPPHQLFQILCECVILQDLSLFPHSTNSPQCVAYSGFLGELKSFTLYNTHHAAGIPFPWKQLKSLAFHDVFVSSIKTFLAEAPHVESLSVIDDRPQHEYLREGPPLLLQSLRSLTRGSIQNANKVLGQLLTDHLITPNLEILHILPIRRVKPLQAPPPPLLKFLQNTQGNLTTFRFDHAVIQDGNTRDSNLRDLVKALRSVREFTAPRVFFNRRLLNEMKQNHLLPNVQRLEISVTSTVAFAIMVETRLDKSSKEEAFIRMKKAYGYYPESYRTAKLRDESKALGRLKRLNALYGTEFGLIAVGVKGPYGRFRIREDHL